MAKFITVTLLLDLPSDAHAIDWVNETLREMQQDYNPESDLVDYLVGDPEEAPQEIDDAIRNGTYEESDAFKYDRVPPGFKKAKRRIDKEIK